MNIIVTITFQPTVDYDRRIKQLVDLLLNSYRNSNPIPVKTSEGAYDPENGDQRRISAAAGSADLSGN